MRKILIFAFALILSGCGYSNWNVFNDDTPKTTQKPAKKPIPKPEPKPQPPVKPETNTTKTRDKNAFTIDQVIKSWGTYDLKRTASDGTGIYIWKVCKSSGKTKTECDGDTCDTIQENKCCERALRTDSEGYVTNLKQAIAKCM